MTRLYWVTKKAGEKTGSGLMKANAWHHRADAISSVVALIGVGKYFSSDLFMCLILAIEIQAVFCLKSLT